MHGAWCMVKLTINTVEITKICHSAKFPSRRGIAWSYCHPGDGKCCMMHEWPKFKSRSAATALQMEGR